MNHMSNHTPPTTPTTLLAWRQRMSLSQADAGRLIGKSAYTWCRMETGASAIPMVVSLLCWVLERHPAIKADITLYMALGRVRVTESRSLQ